MTTAVEPKETVQLPHLRQESPFSQVFSTWREVMQRDRMALFGVIIYVFFMFVAIFAPVIAPYEPNEVIQEDGIWLSNEKPSSEFWLGTTNLGRDIFSQLVYGTRPALLVGFSAAIAVAVIGTVVLTSSWGLNGLTT